MKKEQTINYIAICNLIDRKIAVEYFPKKKKETSSKFRQAAKDLIEKLILISITSNERYSESLGEEYKIFSTADASTRWCFLSIVIPNYPERIAYKMLGELENKALYDLNKNYLDKIGQEENSSFKKTADSIQLYMCELEQKYRDIGNVDQIKSIQKDVDEIQTDMKSNMNKMILNLELVSSLEHKSDALKQKANDYKISAKELSKATWWSNKKLTVAIGGVGLLTLGFVIFKFII